MLQFQIKYIAITLLLLLLTNCGNTFELSPTEQTFLQNNKNLTVGVYIYFPPYEFVNKDGEIDGILIDYFKLIEERVGHKFKRKVFTNWTNLLNATKNGEVDVVLEIQKTEQRSKYLNFTKPIFKGEHIIIAKKKDDLNTLKDLKGKKVAVGKGFSVEEFLKKNHPEIVIVPQRDEKQCLLSVTKNEVDATIGLKTINTLKIKQLGLNKLEIKSAIDYNYNLSIGINKNYPALTSIINRANNNIKEKEKNTIVDKWLFNITRPFYETLKFWKVLCFVLGIAIVSILGWSTYLKLEVKRRTKDLFKAKQTAEKNDTLKTLFLQNISHEVRTPLNGILGFTNLIKNSENKDEKQEYLNALKSETANLVTILDNIIEISNLNTQKINLSKDKIDLHDFFKSLSKKYTKKAKLKNLKFIYQNNLNEIETTIISDKMRLKSSIKNILDNAIKFTTHGAINFSVHTQDGYLLIKITDTGCGVKNKELALIFKEFYQVEKKLTKKYDGLGIGLSIAAKHIKSLHGKIDVKNNNGLEFTIKLPIKFIDV